jgi:outer membrane protein TolC
MLSVSSLLILSSLTLVHADPIAADLGALLDEARDNSPALRAAAARAEASAHVASQAGALPDPEVGIGYSNVGTDHLTLGEDDFALLTFYWTQPVPYPGKRDGAAQAATLGAAAAGRDLDRLRLEIGAEVERDFADLYRLDRTAELLRDSRSVLETVAGAARARYEAGLGTQETLLKAQTEMARLDADAARVALERRGVELNLLAAIGRSDDATLAPVEALPEARLTEGDAALVEESASGSPGVATLEAQMRRAEAGLHLARLNEKPDFVWTARYDNRGGFDPIITGMFGVRLPLSRKSRQVQGVAQAELDLEATRHDLDERRLRTKTMARAYVAQVEQSTRLLDLYEHGVIPLAQDTLESARASYAAGRVEFLDVLGDVRTLLATRMEHLTHETERFKALAALEPLLGRPLILPDRTGPGGTR